VTAAEILREELRAKDVEIAKLRERLMARDERIGALRHELEEARRGR